MLEDKTIERPILKSFQENLIQRLGPDEGRALDVLGTDFFHLVDQLSTGIHEKHEKDAPLLDLNESEFTWELQVFANQFLRECAQTPRSWLFFVWDCGKSSRIKNLARSSGKYLTQHISIIFM